jgi:hypothetical protein
MDGRFVLGPRLGELVAALPDPLVAAAGPVLAWVRDDVPARARSSIAATVTPGVHAAAERVSGLRTTVPVGARLPMTLMLGRPGAVRVARRGRNSPTSCRAPSSASERSPMCAGAAGRSQSRSARLRRVSVSARARTLLGRRHRGDLDLVTDRAVGPGSRQRHAPILVARGPALGPARWRSLRALAAR